MTFEFVGCAVRTDLVENGVVRTADPTKADRIATPPSRRSSWASPDARSYRGANRGAGSAGGLLRAALVASVLVGTVATAREPAKPIRPAARHVEIGFGSAAGSTARFRARLSIADRLPTLRVTTNGRVHELIEPTPRGAGSVAAAVSCGPITYADPALFEGGRFSVQAGFEEGEIAYAVYDVDPSLFPITIESMECVFAQTTSNRTTTHWSVIIWDGPPLAATGLKVGEFSSDGMILPHIILPGPNGERAVNLRVEVDPSDPEPIQIFNDSGTNQFSIGFRIDAHNNPPAGPCIAPDPVTNAFPTTDVDRFCVGGANDGNLCDPNADCPGGGSCLIGFCLGGSNNLANCNENTQCSGGECTPDVNLDGNWLSATICGNDCDGTNSFRDLFPILCRPTGDWVIRATFSCTFIGACCDVDAVCAPNVPNTLCAQQRGTFMGDGTTCGQVMCPAPVGACCLGGNCLDSLQQPLCEGLSRAVYMGNGAECSPTLCDLGACCMLDGSCLDQVEAACVNAGGTFHGGTACGLFSCPQPRGACCVQNTCLLDQAKDACQAVGTWVGTDTTCTPDPCGPSGCTDTPILGAAPEPGTIDARQPYDVADTTPRQGIGSAADPIVLTLGVTGEEACFDLCETQPDASLGDNGIASVTDAGGGVYEIVLNRAVTPGAVTTILHTGGGTFVEYLSHPGNVNADTIADAGDMQSLADVLRGATVAAYGVRSADLDHSGQPTPADLLREVDLLLGAGTLDPWLGTTRPIRAGCP